MYPEVSVLITSYNDAAYVGTAIDSVLNQTVPPDEVIVVDANSTDGSRELLREYDREHDIVELVLLDEDPGIPATRNRALDRADGEYVTYLDSDDRFCPSKLEMELDRLRETDTAGVYSDHYFIDTDGTRQGRWGNDELPQGDLFRRCFTREWPRNSLFRNELTKRDALLSIGGYDESLEVYEDWDLRIRLTSDHELSYCPHPLSEYRRHDGGVSRRIDTVSHKDAFERVVEKNEPLLTRLRPPERRAVKSQLRAELSWLDTQAALRERRRLEGLWHYTALLARSPRHITNVGSVLGLLFGVVSADGD